MGGLRQRFQLNRLVLFGDRSTVTLRNLKGPPLFGQVVKHSGGASVGHKIPAQHPCAACYKTWQSVLYPCE